MKVVIAIDSFKGSVSSLEAGKAIEKGIHTVNSEVHTEVIPVADGGEGTLEALTYKEKVQWENITVHGPFMEKLQVKYAGIPASRIAIIELSQACGITLLKDAQLDPYHTTTYGLGEMMKDALKKGYRHCIIGIGGSCTNDAGAGMLQALGYRFLDTNAKEIPQGGIYLKNITSLDTSEVCKELKECTFTVICDVDNPLCGIHGASYIYGPQKGADEQMVKELDDSLEHFACVTKQYFSQSDDTYPGSGAAGGVGFALHTYCHASLEKGIEVVSRQIHLEEKLKDADLVITGEGRMDAQTCMGKTPAGIARLAKKYHIPVVALCGCATEEAVECNRYGIDAYFPILQSAMSLQDAMSREIALHQLTLTSQQVFRLFMLNEKQSVSVK